MTENPLFDGISSFRLRTAKPQKRPKNTGPFRVLQVCKRKTNIYYKPR